MSVAWGGCLDWERIDVETSLASYMLVVELPAVFTSSQELHGEILRHDTPNGLKGNLLECFIPVLTLCAWSSWSPVQ